MSLYVYIYVCVWIDFNDLTWNDGQALHAKHLVIKIECGVGNIYGFRFRFSLKPIDLLTHHIFKLVSLKPTRWVNINQNLWFSNVCWFMFTHHTGTTAINPTELGAINLLRYPLAPLCGFFGHWYEIRHLSQRRPFF